MSNRIAILRTIAVALLASLLMFSGGVAEAASDRSAFLRAFKHSYENPGNVDAALTYAAEAVKIGDYEAAIPPLERILMFNPKLSEVRLEVGVLYYLLNSSDMARKHLSLVAQDDNAGDQLKSRATSYLAKL